MLKKVIIIILILTAIFIYTSNNVYAIDEAISEGDGFLSAATENPIDNNELKKTSDYLFNIVFAIGVVLAVAIGTVIGIQFIIGSVDEKAKIKETLIPYVIGVFVVFASLTIWKIAITIGETVSPTPSVSSSTSSSSPSSEVGYCPYCGQELLPGQMESLREGSGSVLCRNPACRETIDRYVF